MCRQRRFYLGMVFNINSVGRWACSYAVLFDVRTFGPQDSSTKATGPLQKDTAAASEQSWK